MKRTLIYPTVEVDDSPHDYVQNKEYHKIFNEAIERLTPK